MTEGLTTKQRVFVERYLANGAGATEAAAYAGYKDPEQAGYENKKKQEIAALLCQALPAVPTALLIPLCAPGGVASMRSRHGRLKRKGRSMEQTMGKPEPWVVYALGLMALGMLALLIPRPRAG